MDTYLVKALIIQYVTDYYCPKLDINIQYFPFDILFYWLCNYSETAKVNHFLPLNLPKL